MRHLFALIALSFIPIAALADRPVVVELYTSQGCSSCPPADALLGDLAGRHDVIALAFHVDYWDYIGWKDEFANPDYTRRQRAYARALNTTSIYTPQMIFNGVEHQVGSRQRAVMRAIQHHQNQPDVANLDVHFSGNEMDITITPITNAPATRYDVLLVEYQPKAMTTITRGENAGRTLTYHNIVRNMERVGNWNGQSNISLQARRQHDGPAVIMLQEHTNGEIIAATRLP